ncbi:MAG: ATP-binding protein [Candidatus Latescibacteria bacterium]|nr:ATP-binding protein [Candidatus Latescibacterota bacterium]
MYPARFTLVAAMNPCPCGYFGDPHHDCHCPPATIQRYLARVSGPLLDRIDLHIDVPAVPYRGPGRCGGDPDGARERGDSVPHARPADVGGVKNGLRIDDFRFILLFRRASIALTDSATILLSEQWAEDRSHGPG